jgi:hypothetical protein
MNELYKELQCIDEFEANFNPTTRSEKRKLEINEILKTLTILNEYNE